MAISTYAELKSALSDWLGRGGDADFATRAPELVALFEADFLIDPQNRFRQMEGRATATASEKYLALPSDYLEMRHLRITSTDPETHLEYVTPAYLAQVWAGSQAGKPLAYTIQGDALAFGPAPDTEYTVEMDYYAFTRLSDSATTNWLLTSYPNVYLYGSLVQAEAYLVNDARVPGWKALRDEALAKLRMSDTQARWAGPIRRRSTYAV